MKGFLVRCLITALGLWIASALLSGVHSSGLLAIIGAGLLLGVINAVVRPIIVLLTLPITVVTLGFFLLVINAAMVALVGKMMNGFRVDGFLWAVATALIVSLVSWGANTFVGSGGGFEMFVGRREP